MNDGRHQREIAELEGGAQFYSAIGRFIAEFSKLESLFKFVIASAVKLPDEYTTAVISHDFAMLCTITQNVLPRHMDEARKTQLNAVIRKARDLNNHRVRIVHGVWRIGRRTGSLRHTSRQKLEAGSYYDLNAREIAAQADIAAELWNELAQFWEPL